MNVIFRVLKTTCVMYFFLQFFIKTCVDARRLGQEHNGRRLGLDVSGPQVSKSGYQQYSIANMSANLRFLGTGSLLILKGRGGGGA